MEVLKLTMPRHLSIHIQKFRLKMTAREMMNFVHFFLLMMGDLIPKYEEKIKENSSNQYKQ